MAAFTCNECGQGFDTGRGCGCDAKPDPTPTPFTHYAVRRPAPHDPLDDPCEFCGALAGYPCDPDCNGGRD